MSVPASRGSRVADTVRYLFSEKRTIEEVQGYCNSNAKDIIAIGFDPAKTFIFSDVCAETPLLLTTQWADRVRSLTMSAARSTGISSASPSTSHSTKHVPFLASTRAATLAGSTSAASKVRRHAPEPPSTTTDDRIGATSWASSFPHIFGEDETKTVGIPALM